MQDLIVEHIPHLRRYARALLRNPQAADDLVQDTLERAWAKRGFWREGSDLRAWLFTVMHNVFVNQFHRSAAAPIVAELDQAMPAVASASAEEAIVLRDFSNALTQLHPDLREVLFLVGVEQLSYQEVAQLLGTPIGTVMSRLSRGRERLRSLLAGGPAAALRRVK